MISIIIPLSSHETASGGLFADLAAILDNHNQQSGHINPAATATHGIKGDYHKIEIIVVGTAEPAVAPEIPHLRWITAPPGRAKQLNAGAEAAAYDVLWFLHADTRLPPSSLTTLLIALELHPNSLLFFDLGFYDGSWLMHLNAYGVWVRSHLLKMPFGDQGFCLTKPIFKKLGDYPLHLDYGEDHVLVWRAHQQCIAVNAVSAKLLTSARKYNRQGWLLTTIGHQYLWLKQAWPEFKRWLLR